MVGIVEGLQAAAAGLGIVKELSNINKAYDEGMLKLKIAELAGSLAKVQIALADAQTEAAKKDAHIAKLEPNFKRRGEDTIESQGFLYLKHADGKPEGLPFCPRCLDKGTMMQIVSTIKAGRPQYCPECKAEYHATEYIYR
jgi:hypothetical protein